MLMAVFCWCGLPMYRTFMAVPYGLVSLSWGLAWLFLMIAEISISKKNEACRDKGGDQYVDGKVVRVCYQGDYLNWYPNYALTVVSFLGW